MTKTRSTVQHRALDLLARREHSRFELDRKLRLKGFAEEDIPGTLDTLEAQGLLSDTRFAQMYCHARSQRGFGPKRIALALHERGVGPELIEQTLAQINSQQWIDHARAAWKKKFSGKLATDYQAWAKQRRFLQYRGFTDEQSVWLSWDKSEC